MTDEMLRSFDCNCKVNPPLRSREHVEAMVEALSDGTIDIISSGHKPSSLEKKMVEIDTAPFGMIALETALSQVITYLIRPGVLNWHQAMAKMSLNPARLLGLPGGTLEIGKPADLVLIDPDRTWKVDAGNLKSKSYNTPLDGVELYGVATHCFVQGRLRFEVAAR